MSSVSRIESDAGRWYEHGETSLIVAGVHYILEIMHQDSGELAISLHTDHPPVGLLRDLYKHIGRASYTRRDD
jgi:hypothetical protein